MSTTSGVFTETTLQKARLRADEIMLDDRIKQQYIPNYNVLSAISAVQTAALSPTFRGKDKDVEIIWQNVCGQSVTSVAECTFGGTKSSTNAETYALGYNKEVLFSESEHDYIDNEFDFIDGVAKSMLAAEKNLIEDFAQYAVGRLNAFKGVNEATTGKGTVSGTDTYVAAQYWDAALMAYLMRVSAVNKFSNPVLLSGQNLYEHFQVAAWNTGNPLNANAFGAMRTYFDLFNVDSVNTPDLVTYLLSTGSVAMASKAYNPTTMEKTQVFTRWSQGSQFVPGLVLDIFYEQECDADFIKNNFKMKLKADIFNNPAGCTATNTGVLTFLCGAVPLS